MSLLLTIGFNRRRSFYLTILILLIYLVIIGFPASAVRATIMGFLLLWAMYLGRLTSSLSALLLTASLMLLLNPFLLKNDIGFQLSFAAVIGIIYLKPLFDRLFSRFSDKLSIKEAVAMTLAAQVTTFPLVVYHFKQFSLIAPVANVLIVPVLPFVLILGIIGIGLSFLLPFLAQLVFWLLSIIMAYLIKVVELLSGLPFAYFAIAEFPPIWMFSSIALIITGIFLVSKTATNYGN